MLINVFDISGLEDEIRELNQAGGAPLDDAVRTRAFGNLIATRTGSG